MDGRQVSGTDSRVKVVALGANQVLKENQPTNNLGTHRRMHALENSNTHLNGRASRPFHDHPDRHIACLGCALANTLKN